MARFAIGGGPPSSERAVFALLRAAAALLGTAFVLLALLYSGYLGYTDIEAPDDVTPSGQTFVVDSTGRRLTYGRSSLSRTGRLWELHLAGPPEQIGDAHGQLTAQLLRELDEQMRGRVEQRYGAWMESWAAAMLLRWDYRGADRHLQPDHRTELAALAAAVPELAHERADSYHRLFLYQCLHGLSQRLDDVLLEGTMFAAGPPPTGPGSGSGNLIIGRNLSFDFGREFEADRVVTIYHPDGKYPFASVGWPGLLGVVTGINARGIFVGVNAARTDDPLEDGAPLPMVLREVLENADTLERAVEIIREASLRTSGVVLVGDGVQRKSVVLEVAARAREDRRAVRGEDEAVVWVTDHMLREAFEGDAQNDWIKRETSSGYRYDRLEELLSQTGDIGPDEAATILRDRRGLGGETLGLGNRNAIENLTTAHSVVIDATAMMMWVGEGPSTLGRYQAFDLGQLLGRDEARRPAPIDDLAADPLLHSEEFHDYTEALRALDHARYLLHHGYPGRALGAAKVALALAPDVGDLHRLLGDIERELGNVAEARRHYERYLELVPGRQRDQTRVKGILAELQ